MEISQQTCVFRWLGDVVISHQPFVEQILFQNMQLLWVFPPFQFENNAVKVEDDLSRAMAYPRCWMYGIFTCIYQDLKPKCRYSIPNMENLGENYPNLRMVFPAYLKETQNWNYNIFPMGPWCHHGCHQLPTGFLGAINSSSLQA